MVQNNFMSGAGDFTTDIGGALADFFHDMKERLEFIPNGLSKFWDNIKDFCADGLEFLKDGFIKIGEGFVWLGEKLWDFAGDAFGVIKNVAGAILEKTKDFASFLGEKFADGLAWAKEAFGSLAGKAKDAFASLMEKTKAFCGLMAEKIPEFCNAIGKKIKEFAQKTVEVFKTLKTKTAAKFEQIKPKIKEFFANAKMKVALGIAAVGVGFKKFGEKFKDHIAKAKDVVKEKMTGLKAKWDEWKKERIAKREERRAGLTAGNPVAQEPKKIEPVEPIEPKKPEPQDGKSPKNKAPKRQKRKGRPAAGIVGDPGFSSGNVRVPQGPFADVDPGFYRGPKGTLDVDPGFYIDPQTPPAEIDPGFLIEPSNPRDGRYNLDDDDLDAIKEIEEIWKGVKHKIDTREKYRDILDDILGGTEKREEFVKSFDTLIKKSGGYIKKYADRDDVNTLEDLFGIMGTGKYEQEETIVANSLDKIVGFLNDKDVDLDRRETLAEVLATMPKFSDGSAIDLGYGLDNVLDNLQQERANAVETPKSTNYDDIIEAEVVSEIGAECERIDLEDDVENGVEYAKGLYPENWNEVCPDLMGAINAMSSQTSTTL
ncbi:MAG: hypothetical protein IJ817_03950 [Clostridia bacterium]|nr:hypothetical protein [Clostridia bacterium]